jgi:hypothetical protein
MAGKTGSQFSKIKFPLGENESHKPTNFLQIERQLYVVMQLLRSHILTELMPLSSVRELVGNWKF